jgi:hypothetical protein
MKRTVALLEAMWRSSDQECARLEAEVERLNGIVEASMGIGDLLYAEVERLRTLALAFLNCQTDENAEALRRALEPKP